jgi:homoserine dehydrogenase
MLREVLGQNRVAVVPGFVARAQDGSTALLGRGGSDLTALFLAERLRAERCRLIKDVDGLYQHDPNMGVASPPRYRTVSWDDAVALGGGIVQAKALRFARERRLPFEVAALGQEEGTVVDGGATLPFAAAAPFIAWAPHCPAEADAEHRLQTGGSR